MKRPVRLVRSAGIVAIGAALMFATLAFAQTTPITTEDNGALVGTPLSSTPGTPSALLTGPAAAQAFSGQVIEMTPATTYTLHCQDGDVSIALIDPSTAFSDCALWTPTPTPVPTATTVPTSTPVPTATLVPTATATAVPLVTINGVPLCDGQGGRPAHDPTKWHPLVARNPDSSVLCTYGHEHGMDPTQFDSTFGPLPLAQQISYPWATISSTGVPENGPDIKHRVYKWIGSSALACGPAAPDGSGKSVTAFREELHADGNLGASVRFHSYWGQYQLTDCANPSDSGTLAVGGHMDYAVLTHGPDHVHVPLSNDPPAGCNINGDSRQEAAANEPPSDSVWYGVTSRPPGCDDAFGFSSKVSIGLNVSINAWGPIDPLSPATLHLWGVPSRNETSITTDALTIYVSGFPTDATGHVNFTGHVDRHGLVVPEVAGQAEGQDYIPLVLQHVKPGAYGGNGPSGRILQADPVHFNGDVLGPFGQGGYYVQAPASP
jgi:hypothetical protein